MVNALAVCLRDAVALAGRYPLLAGADLDVRTGEILVLKGANGAGKTSLLRVVAGVLPLAAGEATVLGLCPTVDARELRRRVGLLGHANGLYDDLTAEENLRFTVRAARLPKTAAADALACLGIHGRLLSVPAGKLSAGQRRRVALAGLLARQPQLWLLDEPHAGLDADNRALLDELLKRVASEGATVLVASHEERTSQVLADRVVTMSGGTVLDGVITSQEVSQPTDREQGAGPRGTGETGGSPSNPARDQGDQARLEVHSVA
ncbi:MAG TPA: heme ABC exporter ATP-binding protein CcmA [Acidimicrobiales bacterium]|nr:heme ABC exporter ATP-binding protein CcmA [Acidimicrobiales bacterium]